MKCGQTNCSNDAAFLYTWPGRPQAGICAEHAPKLAAVARAIGLFLELLPVLVLALLGACGGDDFAAAAAADVDAGPAELVDAGAERVAVDRGAELVDVSSEGPGAERVDSDAGAELVDVAGELVDGPADVAGEREAEAAPPIPTMCKSIDGTGFCAPGGPWPYPCCRSSPCECCNKPNCGTGDQ